MPNEEGESSESEAETSDEGGVSSGNDEIVPDSEEESDEGGLRDYQLARDRERRVGIKRPGRFDDQDVAAYALNVFQRMNAEEPQTYEEAIRCKDRLKWIAATNEEMESLLKNHTWKLIQRPEKERTIGCKWIFKLKPGIKGVEEPRYKARLVAKGFSQIEGIDYHEVFSPVVKHTTIRLVLSMVVDQDLELEQLDVKTAFLHGNLDEKILMEQPQGFEKGNQDYVYLLLYVDDMLVVAKDIKEITRLKHILSREFEMKDLGAARRILGIDIFRDRKRGILQLSQQDYLERVLKDYGMLESRSVQTPIGTHFKLSSTKAEDMADTEIEMKDISYSNAVGSLMYAMVSTRPDIAHAVGLVSRFMSSPCKDHWMRVKWVLRYIRNTTDFKLTFTKSDKFEVKGYCDSDYAADLDRRRSITGYVFQTGGNTISWRSGLQHIVALSTTEAEYMALVEAAKEALWLKGIVVAEGSLQISKINTKVTGGEVGEGDGEVGEDDERGKSLGSSV
ncbi:unnamed protein product [Microthlaspi erraticum]|uniref:Reverse transcriptase Ty1/copia-type domain-containing protein n=1 Tax=Microthlaspi erraticum TaxID=1685480 RepID=A0A6D2J9B1_9BRAS|nr:unnamed protein product [Microthlaspi erraticum]